MRRVALVRGPGLNSWETQLFSPLADTYEFVGITTQSPYFDISKVPFPVRKQFSVGHFLRSRHLRKPMIALCGDYHDMQMLGRTLRAFDIVHCLDTMYYYSYQAARARKNGDFKLVLTVWENIPFLHHNKAAARHKALIFEQADMFIAVSERAKEVLLLEGAPGDRICVTMPGIDTARFHPMEKDENLLQTVGCRPDDIIILYVANLFREKGIYDLLFAFRSLLNRIPAAQRVKLLIAGRGRERDGVARTIASLKLTNHASLLGPHGYDAMPGIHNLADIFVLPSLPIRTWQEQFGYVLAESMACGKAIVSTMSGSIPEVVGDAGILVQPNDFVSLAQALERLLVDADLRRSYGRRARQRAEDLFDANKVSATLRRHYDSLFEQRARQ
jgi:alpha-maltose-1-phosphate synthase